MSGKHTQAWNDFWAQNAGSGAEGGCLPAKWQGIDAAQRACWTRFFDTLPRKARLLDMATGDGRVMAWCLKQRTDVKPVGVDLAPELPVPPKGAKVRTGVAMENLPFHDDQFAAVVSQFGFEYGEVSAVAAEAARVLQPDGRLAIMTHRIDGPILAHNLQRREQIAWVLDEQDLIEIARRNLKLRATGLQTLSPKLSQAPAEGAKLFGPQSAAWEIAEAIRRTMVLGARDRPENVAQLLDTIAGRARNEIGRIESLEAACRTTADQEAFLAEIRDGGMEQMSVDPVREARTAQPFADFRIFSLPTS